VQAPAVRVLVGHAAAAAVADGVRRLRL
jgi:hypothetical protein